MTVKSKEYYTSREAAELLGVAVSTIQQWTNSGVLSAWTTGGGHRRITRDSVEKILNQKMSISNNQDEAGSLSVIIVEDDAQQRKLYKNHINNWDENSKVVLANDGYEGLVKVGQTIPDIIISDLLMPNINGFKMIRVLKQISELKDCLIVVISGLDEEEIQKHGGLPEGVMFFRKPVPFGHLEALFREKQEMKKSAGLAAAS